MGPGTFVFEQIAVASAGGYDRTQPDKPQAATA
jgi:hypothetical protein